MRACLVVVSAFLLSACSFVFSGDQYTFGATGSDSGTADSARDGALADGAPDAMGDGGVRPPVSQRLFGSTQHTCAIVGVDNTLYCWGAANRLGDLLSRHQPAVVVVELGGNDGLRGYPIKRLRANLVDIATRAETSGARVLLLGMEIPPNYGSRYTLQFRDSFARVADETGSTLVPFMLEGIATQSALMQADGIHPRPEAQNLLLENVWPSLEPLL